MEHGSVAIYKRDNCIHKVTFVNIENLNDEGIFECCCISIPNKKVTISVCYRPLSFDFHNFLKVFNEFLNSLSNMSGKIIIGGYYNIDLLVHNGSSMLFEDFICFNFKSVISSPSRVTPVSKT